MNDSGLKKGRRVLTKSWRESVRCDVAEEDVRRRLDARSWRSWWKDEKRREEAEGERGLGAQV